MRRASQLFFGLEGNIPRSMADVAKEMGIPKNKVGNYIERALAKLGDSELYKFLARQLEKEAK